MTISLLPISLAPLDLSIYAFASSIRYPIVRLNNPTISTTIWLAGWWWCLLLQSKCFTAPPQNALVHFGTGHNAQSTAESPRQVPLRKTFVFIRSGQQRGRRGRKARHGGQQLYESDMPQQKPVGVLAWVVCNL